MSNLIKSILLLSFFVCLTSLAFADNNGNNNNNGHENHGHGGCGGCPGQTDEGDDWTPPTDQGEGNPVLCDADETCNLFVNVICPISITCSGDQELTICAGQDLLAADLEDFAFDFMIGGAPGMGYSFTVTVPMTAETETPLTGTETAITTDGISLTMDVNGSGHAGALVDLGDITTATGGNYVFTSVTTNTLPTAEGDDCLDAADQPIITVRFTGIDSDATTQIGLQRFPILVHADYVI